MGKVNRSAIIALHKSGKRPRQIAKELSAPPRTVYYTIKRYEELGNEMDRPRSGRPRTANIPKNRDIVRKRVKRNPRRSIRKMAKDLHISVSSVRRIVKKKLDLIPYKLVKAHFLTEKMKNDRLQKARKLKRHAASGRHTRVLFSDEKLFTIEQAHNHQNDRILLPKGSHANLKQRIVARQHHPKSIMIWAGITATGKTPLVFIENGVKVNAEVYVNQVLRNVVLPWATDHFGGNGWAFQQDWAPAHKAKMSQSFCKEHFPDWWGPDLYPSNSPDLNPMDYAVWGILEHKACSKPHKNLEALKRDLKKAWAQIDDAQLRSIIDDFPKRLKACINAKGGHFEIN